MNDKPKLYLILFALVVVSLACQLTQAINNPTPASTLAPTVISATATATPLLQPSATPTPTPTATVSPRILPTPITCNNDTCISQCLKRIRQVIDVPGIVDEEPPSDSYNEYSLVIYEVTGNEIKKPFYDKIPAQYKPYQDNSTAHLDIWNYFQYIVPAEVRQDIAYYDIYTDGPGNYVAWVDWADDEPGKWVLGIDILDAVSIPELTRSLVHESAHLLTLDDSQFEYDSSQEYDDHQDPSVCPDYMSNDGCSDQGSYINLFYKKFWQGIHPEWLAIVDSAGDDEELFYDEIYKFYRRYSRQFHDPYAASHIVEDMAVSWEFFILEPKPDGSNIAEKKVLFYYQFPELVEYRIETIEAICSYLPEQ